MPSFIIKYHHKTRRRIRMKDIDKFIEYVTILEDEGVFIAGVGW